METSHRITRPDIDRLVEIFYSKVRVDPDIGPIFNATVDNWPAHLRLLKDFWSTVLLTERSYKGDPMAKHLPLSLDEDHFARWLSLFAETAREVMPAQDADVIIMKSQRIAENFKAAIAFQRGERKELGIYRSGQS